jgi:CRISPR-associated endoribonuclease Cas6
MKEGPYAVVMEFRLAGSRALGPLTPEGLHGAFLGLLSRGDRALGKLLHSPKLGRRPFSLHPLGVPGRDGKLRLRISVLAPDLFSRFWERWEARGGIPLRLDGSLFQPFSLSADGPWCGTRPWRGFLNLEVHKEVILVFATPTAFKAGDLDLPLPVPRLVFGSLLKKWNTFSPYPLGISVQELERKVALAEARVRTKAFFDGRSHIVGFVGRARFRVLRGASPELLQALGILSRFAFFAGVGRKATHGMGLTIPGG